MPYRVPLGQVLHSGDLICEGTILAGKVLQAAATVAPALPHSAAMAADTLNGKPKQAAEEDGHALQKPTNGDLEHLPTNGNLEHKEHLPNGNLDHKQHLANGNLEHKEHLPTNGNLEHKKHLANGNLEHKEHLPINGNLENKCAGSRLGHVPSTDNHELTFANGALEHRPTNGDLQLVPTNGERKQLPAKNGENEVVCLQASMLPCCQQICILSCTAGLRFTLKIT